MNENNTLAMFKKYNIRRVYIEAEERWYFSVVDVILVLTDSAIPKRYWSDLKKKLINEGNEPYEKIVRLKMIASDGKLRETDVADTETLLRLIQSIPSPKAEPLKLWLAKVGYERIEDISNPEKGINRSREYWQKMGRSEKWIQQRMMGQETRNKLTDYWSTHKVKEGKEFAILTDIIHKEWSGLTVKGHKKVKNLDKQNLRDHMNEAELLFTSLAELSTRTIAQTESSEGLIENIQPAKRGGKIARKAKIEFEKETNTSVISQENFLPKLKNKRSR